MAPSREDPEVSIPLTPVNEEYKRMFDRADRDHDGYISVHELRRMIENHEDNYPQQLIEQIHRMSDKNNDGRLDFDEFIAMINNPQLKHFFSDYVNKYIKFIIPRKATDQIDYRGSYEEEYTCWPPKLAMIMISLIEICFFIMDEVWEKNSTNTATGPTAKLFIYDPKKRYQIWRYLTYMFVHIGYLHIVVNVAVQIFIGVPLEMVHGWWRVPVIYLAGVVAGSLFTSITDPTSKLAGASGGVYSLITAHIASIIMNWKEMSFPAVQLAIFLLITGCDVGSSIYNRYIQNTNEHIGYVAHFAGAIAGLLVGINVLRNLQVTRKEKYIWWISMITFIVLMVGAIFWNVFYTDFFPKSIYENFVILSKQHS